MSVYAGPNIIENGLVLCLDAANVKSYPGSGTTWTDLSGNGNNGTLVASPTYNTDARGNILFNGTTQYATGTTLALTSYTLGFWIRFLTLPTGLSTEEQILNTPGSTFGISIVDTVANGTWRWQSWNGSTGRQSSTTVTTNVWYNFAMTGTSTTAQFFLNGLSTDSFATGASISSGTIYLAAYNAAADRSLNCNISNVSFYNRVLSTSEIMQNFNALRGRFGI